MVRDAEEELRRTFGNVTKLVMPRHAAPPLPTGGNRPNGPDFQDVHDLIRHQHREMTIAAKDPVAVRFFLNDSALEDKGKLNGMGE